MVVFSLTIGLKYYHEKEEKARLSESIALGRGVQDLLLPQCMEDEKQQFSYLFKYAPHQGMMSGDWLNHWESAGGVSNFLIGDVTGKGPQAALAVAIISTVIQNHSREGHDALRSVYAINDVLFQFFGGKMTTTVTGIMIFADGRARIFNAGGAGWFIFASGTVRQHLGRSSLVGTSLHMPPIDVEDITLEDHRLLYTFTDGVCSGAVETKRMTRRLTELLRKGAEQQRLCEEGLAFCDENSCKDDKAMLTITSKIVRPAKRFYAAS
jgi:serine phosphatase RsbU (regulator of sigma subunit)